MFIEMDDHVSVEIQHKQLLLRFFQVLGMVMDATDIEDNKTHSLPSKISQYSKFFGHTGYTQSDIHG